MQEVKEQMLDLYTHLWILLKIARENPDKKVIFFAIGFETTTPMDSCTT